MDNLSDINKESTNLPNEANINSTPQNADAANQPSLNNVETTANTAANGQFDPIQNMYMPPIATAYDQNGQPCYTATYVSPKKSFKKFIFIGIAALAVLLICLFIFNFKKIKIAFSPNTYVAASILKTGNAINSRFSSSPLAVVGDIAKTMQNGTMDYSFSANYTDEYYSDSTVNSIGLKGTVQQNTELKQLAFNGDFTIDDVSAISFATYKDEQQKALSVPLLFGSSDYYGYNTQTAADDFENSVFYYTSDSEYKLDKDTCDTIHKLLQVNTPSISSTPLSAKELSSISTNFLSAGKAYVTTEKININGQNVSCYKVAYTYTQKSLNEFLSETKDVFADSENFESYCNSLATNNNDTNYKKEFLNYFTNTANDFLDDLGSNDLTVTYYVNKNNELVKIKAECENDENLINVLLDLGAGPTTTNSIALKLSCDFSDMDFETEAIYETNSGAGVTNCTEDFEITFKNNKGVKEDITFKFSNEWDTKSNELLMNFSLKDNTYADNIKLSCSGALSQKDNVTSLSLDKIKLIGAGYAESDIVYSLKLDVMPGCDIKKPNTITNIFTMSEDEVYNLYLAIYSSVNGLSLTEVI